MKFVAHEMSRSLFSILDENSGLEAVAVRGKTRRDHALTMANAMAQNGASFGAIRRAVWSIRIATPKELKNR